MSFKHRPVSWTYYNSVWNACGSSLMNILEVIKAKSRKWWVQTLLIRTKLTSHVDLKRSTIPGNAIFRIRNHYYNRIHRITPRTKVNIYASTLTVFEPSTSPLLCLSFVNIILRTPSFCPQTEHMNLLPLFCWKFSGCGFTKLLDCCCCYIFMVLQTSFCLLFFGYSKQLCHNRLSIIVTFALPTPGMDFSNCFQVKLARPWSNDKGRRGLILQGWTFERVFTAAWVIVAVCVCVRA